MSVAVIGVGAIGGLVAAELLAVGADVTLCTRSPLDRLVVERDQHPRDVATHALTDPAHAEAVRFVVVALKAQDSASAAPWLARLAGPDTTIVVIQNGVEHDARLSPYAVVPARTQPSQIRVRVSDRAGWSDWLNQSRYFFVRFLSNHSGMGECS